MTMTVIWTGMVALSVLCSLATGRGPAVAAAADPGKELSIGYVERAGECRAVWLSD